MKVCSRRMLLALHEQGIPEVRAHSCADYVMQMTLSGWNDLHAIMTRPPDDSEMRNYRTA